MVETRRRSPRSEESLRQLYRAACGIGKAIREAEDLQEAFQLACRLVVETAGMRMAWISEIDWKSAYICPDAWAGYSDGYAENLKISIGFVELGKGPAGKAFRSKDISLCRDVSAEPDFTPWREAALERGYLSLVGVPLLDSRNQCLGLFLVYSGQIDGFGEDELSLLRAVANHLMLAMESVHRERSLQESRDQFGELVNNIGEGFFAYCRLTDRLIYSSPEYWEVLGLDEQEVTLKDFHNLVHPEDSGGFLEVVEKAMSGRETDLEFRIIRPSGEVVWIHEHTASIKGDDGEVVRVIGVLRDITRHKEMEAQLYRTQRLESLGTLAGGIAHDLNNVLAPISLSIDLLNEEKDDERRRQIIAMIKSSASRGSNLVKQVLLFARGAQGPRETLCLMPLLEEVTRIGAETFPKSIRIVREFAPDLGPVNGDSTHLQQVFINLCVNARDSMPRGGRLLFRARNRAFSPAEANELGLGAAGEYVELEVTDEGEGMTAEVRDRIFEPFFTTKELGQGTGLGLSTCLAIVRSHGGLLQVDSTPGQGSTFRVLLPQTEGVCPVTRPGLLRAKTKGEGRSILVVDDEEMVRDILCRTLESLGYRVSARSGAQEAIERLRTGSQVDLLVTDMMMPGMNGPELVAWIRREMPQIKVVGTSGLSREEFKWDGEELQVDGFIDKPFGREQLSKVVASVLP
ncbi:hybrid sensor histidine kinase/response regulator [Roseibacillus ishigakijimensis]|uniref:hybrid sensor histidine kinase/response regulator n=1 Tax=Roseibacillus ishigakijimensis TaxID=454146 RepID=UPI001F15F4D2|nr:ATP-binding protein [Roseibacillus ishigakijimensis]